MALVSCFLPYKAAGSKVTRRLVTAGGGGRDDSAGTRETARLTDSRLNMSRNMAAPGESSVEEWEVTPLPKKIIKTSFYSTLPLLFSPP